MILLFNFYSYTYKVLTSKNERQNTVHTWYFLIVMAICLFRVWTPPLSSFEFWWDTELQTKRKTFFNWNWGIFVFFIIINRRTYLRSAYVHLPSNRVVGTWGPDFADCFNPRGGGRGQIMHTTFQIPPPHGFSDLPTALFQIMHKEMDSLVFFSLCLSTVLSHSYALLYIHKVRFNPVLYLLCTVFCTIF